MATKKRKTVKSKKEFTGVNVTMARKVLEIVDWGLVSGLGSPVPGQMCVEAAVAYAYGEDHNDRPKCVDPALAEIKIGLNDDGAWADDADRAFGLRRLAIAQLGSKGKFDENKFWELYNDGRGVSLKQARKIAIADLTTLQKSIAKMIRNVAKMDERYDIKDVFDIIRQDAESCADRNDPENDEYSYIGDYTGALYADSSPHVTAERMVQALVKMKVPGTKYLYLTETKKRAKNKKTGRKTAKAKRK